MADLPSETRAAKGQPAPVRSVPANRGPITHSDIVDLEMTRDNVIADCDHIAASRLALNRPDEEEA
jgi:hypothetical protein